MDNGSPLRVAITVDRADAHRDGRLHRHRRPARGQLQCAAGGDPRRGALRVPLPGRRRHPAERRLPEAAPAGDPARHLPVAASRARRSSPATPRSSQATCNALFGALGAIACSQATMNNFLFGDATRQYYETICGGTGAGPGFDGTSAVHTHMTNTRMTDPEVLELRYPVRLEAIRDPPRLRRRRTLARRRRRGAADPVPRADDRGHRLVAPQRRAVRARRRRRWRASAGNGSSARTAAATRS